MTISVHLFFLSKLKQLHGRIVSVCQSVLVVHALAFTSQVDEAQAMVELSVLIVIALALTQLIATAQAMMETSELVVFAVAFSF